MSNKEGIVGVENGTVERINSGESSRIVIVRSFVGVNVTGGGFCRRMIVLGESGRE